ncbi:hypothetical protein KRX57_08315 [Weeksellaceae bacterium TAE3-ERU29]|nr:hypothetical protein [Weeksellaceae bacterium TAE3-ERU29]
MSNLISKRTRFIIQHNDKLDTMKVDFIGCDREGTRINDSTIFFSSSYVLINSEKVDSLLLDIMVDNFHKGIIYSPNPKSRTEVIEQLTPCNLPLPIIWWKEENNDTLHTIYQDTIEINFVYEERE